MAKINLFRWLARLFLLVTLLLPSVRALVWRNVGYVYLNWATVTTDLGTAAQAITAFEKAQALHPKDKGTWRGWGMTQMIAGNREVALESLSYLETPREQVECLLLWGTWAQEQMRGDDAHFWYEQVIKYDGFQAEGWQQIGLLYEEREAWAEARYAFEKMWQIDPSRARWLVYVLQREKDYAGIEAVLAQTLQAVPISLDRVWWWWQWGEALEAQGKWEDAGNLYQQGLREFPDSYALQSSWEAVQYKRERD